MNKISNLVHQGSKTFLGVSTTTNNADEMQESAARIPALWEKFAIELAIQNADEATTYGVYSQYQNQDAGDYQVLAGIEISAAFRPSAEFVLVTAPAGDYLLFEKQGAMPEVVHELWQQAWRFFRADNLPVRRTYQVDYECYQGSDQNNALVQLFVGVEKV